MQLPFRLPVFSSAGLAVRPSKGSCTFAMAFAVDRGAHGTGLLDGLGFIVLGLMPRKCKVTGRSVSSPMKERALSSVTLLLRLPVVPPVVRRRPSPDYRERFSGSSQHQFSLIEAGAKWSIMASDCRHGCLRPPGYSP